MNALNAALVAQGWQLVAEVPANPADLRPDDADALFDGNMRALQDLRSLHPNSTTKTRRLTDARQSA